MNMVSILVLLAALIVVTLLTQLVVPKPTVMSHRQQRRFRIRPFTRLERLAVPFIFAMSQLHVAWQKWFGGDNRIILANTLQVRGGTGDSKLSDEAIGRYTIVKLGTDEDHVGVCDAGDIPLGSTTEDSASGAEQRVHFDYLGLGSGTRMATASGAITAGAFLVPANDGKLQALPIAPGNYYICGRAVQDADDGQPVIFVPCFPQLRVVQ